MLEKIRAAGGEVYALTSEPQSLATQAEQGWGLPFQSIGDPHHEISDACRERGLLQVFVNPKTDIFEQDGATPFRHPKGYFQPGVLALASDSRVLYRWRSVPTRSNLGGAISRPTADHVWTNVRRELDAALSSAGVGDAALDTKPELDAQRAPWPLFVSLLVANGWFLEPRPFPFVPGGPSVRRRILRAGLRIPFFVAAWAIAFAQLPTLWVGLAFVGWAAWLTPKIRFIHDQFQNVAAEG